MEVKDELLDYLKLGLGLGSGLGSFFILIVLAMVNESELKWKMFLGMF